MAQRVGGRFEKSARVTPANGITLLRLLGSPVVVVVIAVLGVSWLAVVVWVGLASTDFVDGWVARRQGATDSGAFLDPLADKFLVLGALGALAAVHQAGWAPVAIIAGREVAMSGYRGAVARRGISVPARPLAKVKTAAQDLAVTLLVLPGVGDRYPWVGRDVLWAAVALAVISGAQYLLDARRRGTPGGRCIRGRFQA